LRRSGGLPDDGPSKSRSGRRLDALKRAGNVSSPSASRRSEQPVLGDRTWASVQVAILDLDIRLADEERVEHA
jgi:hypothetical protein